MGSTKQPCRPHHIGVEVFVKPIEAAAYRHLRGEVKNTVDICEGVGDRCLLANIPEYEPRRVWHDVTTSDGKVVEHRYAVTRGQQCPREMAADEPCTAGHK